MVGRPYVEFVPDEKLPTLIRCHENAFHWFGGITEEILYDNPKTIVIGREGEAIHMYPPFEDFCRYYGYHPRLCRPYRAQTKGKVESGVKYIKRSFLPGRTFLSLDDMNIQVQQWICQVADQRIHGTVHEKPAERFLRETLFPLDSRPQYIVQISQTRKVAFDSLISYEACRYSVPWKYVRKTVDVQEKETKVLIYYQNQLIAEHQKSSRKYQMVLNTEHYRGLMKKPEMPVPFTKTVSPDVAIRSLQWYEAIAGGEIHG